MLRFGAGRILRLWSELTLRRPRRTLSSAPIASAESFLNGSSGVYIEEMYESWLNDPSSVHKVAQCLVVSSQKCSM